MFSSTLEQMHPFGMPRPMPGGGGHRPWKPNVEVAPNCPRCDSPNTKFCYYNNYSLTQPRYFCKGCRRYWTKGGSLRNVPVGGGCRKNRRGKSSASARVLSTPSGLRASTRPPPPSGCGAALRPDLALDDMVGGRSSHQSMVSPPPDHDRDASGTIDLAALYSRFLNHCPEYAELQGGREGQFDVPELADGYEMGMMGELSNYPFDVDVVDVASGGYESGSLGMPESMSAAEVVLFPGLSTSWQAPELQPGLCPFPGMGTCSDWSSLDQSSFGAF